MFDYYLFTKGNPKYGTEGLCVVPCFEPIKDCGLFCGTKQECHEFLVKNYPEHAEKFKKKYLERKH